MPNKNEKKLLIKTERIFIKNKKYPDGFESFMYENYNKQQKIKKIINKKIAGRRIDIKSGMANDELHQLFKQKFFMTSVLEKIILNTYNDADLKKVAGTTFFLIDLGFSFYNINKIKKIALECLIPGARMIPFCTHGSQGSEGFLALDYRENDNTPSVLYFNTKLNKLITVAKTFDEFLSQR